MAAAEIHLAQVQVLGLENCTWLGCGSAILPPSEPRGSGDPFCLSSPGLWRSTILVMGLLRKVKVAIISSFDCTLLGWFFIFRSTTLTCPGNVRSIRATGQWQVNGLSSLTIMTSPTWRLGVGVLHLPRACNCCKYSLHHLCQNDVSLPGTWSIF